MNRNLRKVLLPATIASVLAAGTISVPAAGAEDVTMAFCTWTGYAPMFIAKELGYFEDAGINMNIEIIEDESTYAALLTQGSVQFLATAQDPNIKMFANGAPSRYVLAMDASCGADGLVTTEDIKSLDDLKGKTLALDTAASSYYFFLTALEDASSLKEEDITLAEMSDTTEAGLAFMSGQVDAAIMWEPELSEALDSVEGAHALVTSANYPETILDSLVVNESYAQDHPEVDYLKENPEEACELMASGFEEVTAEDIAGDMEGLQFFGREENETLNDSATERSIKAISQDMADFWMEKGECSTNDLTEFFSLLG